MSALSIRGIAEGVPPSWFTESITTESKPLTIDDIIGALDEMNKRAYTLHVHLISPAAHERGEGLCIECGAWVVCHDR